MLNLKRLICSPHTRFAYASRRYIASVVEENYDVKDVCIKNEPILKYESCSKEKDELKKELKKLSSCPEYIPVMIGCETFSTANVEFQKMPHDHAKNVASFSMADDKLIQLAICKAKEAQRDWDHLCIQEKIKIFTKAADLISGEYRMRINAATMLGQGKTVQQAEIDAACELADFLRFNVFFLKQLLTYKPLSPEPQLVKNSALYRGIEGFVAAISPFNFTAIGGNLATAPVLMGNTVLWKPSKLAVLSNWYIFEVFRKAGLPPNIINFIPARPEDFAQVVTASPDLAGINFTGSVKVFQNLWNLIGKNISSYKNYPRIGGECGGKGYHFVHCSADLETVVATTIRAAFEYSGQKCSACSRMYVPESLWPSLKDMLCEELNKLKIGDVEDFTTFTSAVINKEAFERIGKYIKYGKDNSKEICLVTGGDQDCSVGYYIKPTIFTVTNPRDRLMIEEIFGPVLTVYVYKDEKLQEALELAANSAPSALTGSIFAQDEKFLKCALKKLRNSAGNLYVNDKCTGAVVGQQPFGGGRVSGTNDKPGGPFYLLKWTSLLTVKETFCPQKDILYSHMK